MRKVLDVIWGGRKPEYFCKGGWTPESANCPTGKSLDCGENTFLVSGMRCNAISTFTRVSTRYGLRCDGLLIRGPSDFRPHGSRLCGAAPATQISAHLKSTTTNIHLHSSSGCALIGGAGETSLCVKSRFLRSRLLPLCDRSSRNNLPNGVTGVRRARASTSLFGSRRNNP